MENCNTESHQKEPARPFYRKPLPNATTVLVLGIISIPTSFCYGIIGIILGIIALAIAKKDVRLHRESPGEYDGYENLNAGRICAIIGLSIGSLFLVFIIFYLIFVASVLFPFFSAAAAS
ncbi:MAG TPA: CCC motif membrane protein [Flavobacterium sp.]|nr:CCC motif membrane protein [Flavobacterium sp.]